MILALKNSLKWLYTSIAVLIVVIAVIVQLGRSLSPSLSQYPQQVSRYLSNQFNAQVTIQALSAEWSGLKPFVMVKDLRIADDKNHQLLALSSAQLRLDLTRSLIHLRPVWSVLSISDVQLDFEQTQDGYWHLRGLTPREKIEKEESLNLDGLTDMLLLSRRIELTKTSLNFHFASGDKSQLFSPLIRMESDGAFHRLQLQVDVDKTPKALQVVVEAKGDPRQREKSRVKGYVELNNFPTSEPVAAASAFLLRGIKAQIQSEGNINGKAWFNSRKDHEGFDWVSLVSIDRLSAPLFSRKLSLDHFSTQIVGNWLYSGKLFCSFQDLNAHVNEFAIEHVNIAASIAELNAPLVVHLQKLDLQKLNKTLSSSGILGDGKLQRTLQTLNPRGELTEFSLAIPTHNPVEWQLDANLNQVGVDPWTGVPGLQKVDGFVHASQTGGFVDINSRNGFSMHYYPTYSAPMEYASARGQVAWYLRPEQNQIYVNSGLLEFNNDNESARGYMWLALPWVHNTGDTDLYLQIGANNLNASLYKKYTPDVVPKSLLTWLEKGIGSQNVGHVNEVGFIYRGTLSGHIAASRNYQLFVDMQNASLNYHPEWPSLTGIKGRLLVDADHVKASVDSAKLFESDVTATDIEVYPNPQGGGELLNVVGAVSGSADDGLRVLRESMLRRYLGASMDSWRMQGNLQTNINIAVPLNEDQPGARQQVDVDLLAPEFSLSNLRLTLKDVQGKISFNETAGLSSQGLQAQLFSEPISLQLSTQQTEKDLDIKSKTVIEAKGVVNSKRLAAWSNRPELLFLQGNIPYQTQIVLNHRTQGSDAIPYALVNVNSNLKGVAVQLPEPYGKSVDQEHPLSFGLSLFDKLSLIDIHWGDQVQTLFLLDPSNDNQLMGANVAIGAPAQLPAMPQFLVSGRLPTFEYDFWKKVFDRYQDYQAQIDIQNGAPIRNIENTTEVAGLPFRADLLLARHPVGPLTLENLRVTAEKKIDSWVIGLDNPVVKGRLQVFNDAHQPLLIDLQQLHLTQSLLGGEAQAGKISGPKLDPRTLPQADLKIHSLFLDGNNYGDWALELRPQPDGVLFDKIQGSVKGVRVVGFEQEEQGAKLYWKQDESGYSSHFVGSLKANNLSDVLQQWQKPDMLESESAHFKADISWSGDPRDFALKKLSGDVSVNVLKGRFKRNPSPGSDGFLRLMAILNFDSLARRLRLDFSDLYKSGLAYDRIDGLVNFQPGLMTFKEPLIVATPSSRLQLAGKLDMEREKINARLIATLPVVGNFTFATALLTGLPAAAGIYVASKLFKKQVDQATSISYRIHGGWDNPVMNFDRLFESEDDLLQKADQQTEEKAPARRRKLVPQKKH